MYALGYPLLSAVMIVDSILLIYTCIIIAAAVLTWVNPDPLNPIVQILYRLTSPVYALIRRFVPTLIGGIDFAPLIVILALQFIDLFAVKLLFAFANAF